jgi:hypothetical protein
MHGILTDITRVTQLIKRSQSLVKAKWSLQFCKISVTNTLPFQTNAAHTLTSFFKIRLNIILGTRWRSWMRHCVTSRKVAGVIDLILPHYARRVDSASNKNEYPEYFLRIKAAGA